MDTLFPYTIILYLLAMKCRIDVSFVMGFFKTFFRIKRPKVTAHSPQLQYG